MIAYQGEPGAFSEQAARRFFGAKEFLKPLSTFAEVFNFAEKHKNSFAIVPIENSVFGSIHQVYDLLLKHKLHIIGEIKLRIELHLMALPNTKQKNVRIIYSQLQAIGQCEDYINKLKDVKVEAVHDTAGAARLVRESNSHDVAAIASEYAAKAYGLQILKRNVESNHRNYTRFIALSKKSNFDKLARATSKSDKKIKTSLVIAVKDIPGALFKVLAVFSLRDINLMKIESRPLIGRPWEYLFYLDVDGIPTRAPLKQALVHLAEVCSFVRILGSYHPYEVESTLT